MKRAFILFTSIQLFAFIASATSSLTSKSSLSTLNPNAVVTQNASGCANNGIATTSPTGGTAPYTYLWSDNSSQKTAAATGLSAGVYTITVTDATSISATASVTITAPAALTLSIGYKTNVACNGGNTGSITAVLGNFVNLTYNYENAVQNFTVPAGITTLTITATGGAGGTSTFPQNAYGGKGAVMSGVITVYGGEVISLVAGGMGGNDSVADGAGGGGGSFVYDSLTGTLMVAAGGGGGASFLTTSPSNIAGQNASTTTTTNPSLGGGTGEGGGASGIGNTYGAGGAGYLGNGTNGTSPIKGGNCRVNGWTGGTGEVASALGGFGGGGGGGYDGGGGGGGYNGGPGEKANTGGGGGASYLNGVLLSSAVTSTGNGSVNVSYAASVGTSPYTYSWTPTGGNSIAASNLSAGTYTLTVRDANNCSATISTTITQPVALNPHATVSLNATECSNNGAAFATPTGGISPYTYLWSDNSSQTNAVATGLSADSYTVTITDANNCTATGSVIITVPAALLANATVTHNSTECNNIGLAQAAPTGGTIPYTYAWSNGSTKSSISSLSANTYTLTVRDANNCSTTASVTITAPATLTANISIIQNATECNNIGAAKSAPTGGTTPYTYMWSTGATTSSTSNLSAAIYIVTVHDANNCSVTANVTITVPAALSANVSITQQAIECSNIGAANSSPSGGTFPYTYSWSNGASTSSISSLSANVYSVTVHDANNCSATAIVTITVPASLSANANVTQNATECNNNGAAQSAPAGGTTPYTYSWSTGATLSSVSSLSANTYTVTVNDANNCSITASVVITVPVALLANASVVQNATECNNIGLVQSASTGGTAPYTYSWSTGATTSSISNLSASIYTVTVYDANNCTATGTVTVTVPAALAAHASVIQNAIACSNNGATQSLPTGGTLPYTYSWSTGDTTSSIDSLSAGTYSVAVTDANNCTATGTVTITAPSSLVAHASVTQNTSSCGNIGIAKAAPTGGTVPYTYSWSNGSTLSSNSGLSAGIYTVTVYDKNNCSASGTITITAPAALAANASVTANTSACANIGTAKAAPTGGTLPYTYSWSTGATISSVISLSAGTYTITVSDKNNCTATGMVTITAPAALTANASVTQNATECNNNGIAQAGPIGGTVPYTYSWSTGATLSSTSNLSAGTYTLTVYDAYNCSATGSVTITVPATLAAHASVIQNTTACSNIGSAQSAPTGGTSPYTYSWTNSGTTSSVTGLSSGTYTVTVTDANSCTATGTATITAPAALAAHPSVTQNTSSCGNIGIVKAVPTGGTVPYTYSWSTGSTLSSISSLSAGTYTVTVRDKNNCSATGTITVTAPAALTANASVTTNTSSCGNIGTAKSAPTGGTAPYTYSWSTGATISSVSGLSAGTYTVTVHDKNSCSATATVTITAPPALAANASVTQSTTACSNIGTAKVSPTGGTVPYTYSWSTGATISSVIGLSAGTYTVTVSDKNNCTATGTVTITAPATLAANATVTQNASECNNNGIVQSSPTGGSSPYTYLWSTGKTTSSISSLSANTYTVSVHDASNCSATASVTVTVPASLISNVSLVQNATACSNAGIIQSSPSGGTLPYTYSWSSGGTNFSISGLSAGTYSVTVTDANNCSTTGTATITAPAVLATNAAIIQNSIGCNNSGAAQAVPTGGTQPYTYSWSNGATVSSISNLSAGTYLVTVTDTNNCSATGSVTITAPATLSTNAAVIQNATECNNVGAAQAVPTGGTLPYTYTWSTGATTSSISNLSASSYTVTINDANNCSATGTVTITVPIALSTNVSITQNAAECNNIGAAKSLPSGGTTPYTYSWSTGAITYTITGLSAGTYSIIVHDANNCSATGSVTITAPASLSANASVTQNTSECTSVGIAKSVPTGGVAPYTYSWSTGATTSSISSLSASTYTLTVYDANNCSVTVTVTITAPASLSANATVTQNASGCSNIGAAQSSPTGGASPYTYSWSTGKTTSSISSLSANTYTVTVHDANNCSATASITITAPAGLAAHTTVVQNAVECSNIGIAQSAPTGGNAPYTYSWSNGATTSSISGLSAASYTVTVHDANNCSGTGSVTITVPAALAAHATVLLNTTECTSAGSAQSAPTGGTSPYTYSWSNGGITYSITGLSSGTYTVTVKDANNCSATGTATITAPAALRPIPSVTQNTSSCGNIGIVKAIPTGGTVPYTYSWSNGSTLSSVSSLSAGTYTITVRDKNNCSASGTVAVTAPAALAANASVTTNSSGCSNIGSAKSAPTGGTVPYTYSWSTGATISSITGLSAGTYTITVIDHYGCSATGTITITAPAPLATNASVTQNTTECTSAGTVKSAPSGGTVPYTYSWSTGATVSSVTGLSAGTYTVTVTDKNSCTATGTIIITAPAALLANPTVTQNASACGSIGTIQSLPSGGTSPYTYSWSTGKTTSSITGLSANTYTITVHDKNNCSATATITVTAPSALSSNVSVVQNAAACGNTGIAQSSPAGGNSPFTYSWSSGGTSSSISGLSAGIYTVTVRDANNCSATGTVTITAVPALVANVSVTQNASGCISNGIAKSAPTGGTSPYTYLWSNGATLSSNTGLSAGTYTVTVSDNTNCTATGTVTVTAPASLAANASVTQNTTECTSAGTAKSAASGGTLPYTYSWSTGATISSVIGLSAGTYTVIVTDKNSCTSTATVIITAPASLTANASITQNASACSSIGSAQSSPAGGVSPYTYSWSTGGTTSSVASLSASTYNVTVRDANNCSVTASVTITAPSLLLSNVSVAQNTGACNNTGIAQSSPAGGNTPYTYSWSTGATTSSITGLSAGTYSVNVTDANNCSSTGTISITAPSALGANASITANASACGNTGIAKSVPTGGTAPYTYSWSTGATISSITGLSAGTYTVTVSDNANCTATGTVSITAPASIAANASVTQNATECGNVGTAKAAPTGGTLPYTYSWSTGTTISSVISLSAGTYTVTVTDKNSCTATGTVIITAPASLLANASITQNASACSSSGAVQSSPAGGVSPYTYSWSTGGTASSISSLSASTYTVTVKDANNCSATGLVTVTAPLNLLAIVSVVQNASTCGNTGIAQSTPAGGNTPYTYSWSTGATTSSITGLSAGVYTVTVTDANNCSATGTATIIAPASLAANATVIQNTTECSNIGAAQSNPTGGTLPYTYEWSNGASTTSISNLSAGSYSVTIHDANNCSVQGPVTITAPAAITQTMVVIQNSQGCSNTGIASVTPSGGTTPYTYSWSDNSSQTTATATGLPGGSYVVTVSDANNCMDTSWVTITQPTVISTTVSSTTVTCPGGSNGSVMAVPTGGATPYTYSWSTGTTSNIISTTATVSGLTAGTYSVSVTDASGCNVTSSVIVASPAAFTAYSIILENVACRGSATGALQIIASGGRAPYTYSWSNGSGSYSVGNLSAGTYTCTATDKCGDIATVSVTITQPATLLTPTVTFTNVTCNGSANGTASVTVSGGNSPYSYLWLTGATTTSISGLSAGACNVKVTDANGCSITKAFTITQPAVVTPVVQSQSCVALNNGTVTLNTTGGASPYTYSWNTGATKATLTGLTNGSYTVTVTDKNHCNGIVLVTVNCTGSPERLDATNPDKKNCCPDNNIKIYPNPNNGRFTVESSVVNGEWSVEIYNTIGQKVFNQSNIQNPASNIDISNQPNGVYLIRIINSDGTLIEQTKVVKTW